MTNVLTLLAMLTLAYLASSLLSSKQRHGYGLVSGAELLALGLIAGPAGLDFLSHELVEQAAPAVVLSIGWIGFLFGLRFSPGELRAEPPAHRVAVLVGPLVTFAVLGGLLLLADRQLDLGLRPLTIGALAAVGSSTTKSGIAWAIGRHGASGRITALLQAVSRRDDLPGVLAMGVIFAAAATGKGPLSFPELLAATFVGGGLLAGLATLLLGREKLREDMAWVAILGFAALGTGLSAQLGVSSLAVSALMGVALGAFSPHGPALTAMTEETERPIVQVLLVLIGAQLALDAPIILLAVGVTLVRVLAKLASGGALWGLRLARERGRPDASRGTPWLGLGMLHSGGVVTVMVLSLALVGGGGPETQLVLWSFVLFSLAGDLLGSPSLKAMLETQGELHPVDRQLADNLKDGRTAAGALESAAAVPGPAAGEAP